MKMEIPEEFSGSTDQTIVKGKRTKRPRPSSSTSSTISGGAAANSSPTTSISVISTSREEDEDMANCLILLARGNSPPPPEKKKSGSRKFTEMATSAAEGKIGIYVYECKTCNRTFPSFQALGGHRASHKKPKSTTVDYDPQNSKPPPPLILPDKQREGSQLGTNTITPPPSIPQLPNKNWDNNHSKPKIHECSICGSEFGSGQALGGHMRRHRPAPPIVATSSSNDSSSSPKNVLGLDLNLPAPTEDEKFHQFPAKQKLFAAAALVDCHY